MQRASRPDFSFLVLLAAFTQLRFGELNALHHSDLVVPPRRKPTVEEIAARIEPGALIDDGMPPLRVSQSLSELDSGCRSLKKPKSVAGARTVNLPAAILPEIREHLKLYAESGSEGRLFIGPKGASPRRSAFNVIWKKALQKSGANPQLHLHDLRHTGSTLSAQTGATLREVMSRIGHGSTRAALIYQHATSERGQRIAAALDLMIREARRAGEEAVS